MHAVNGSIINIRSCRATHRTALVAQARHTILGHAGPGTITISPCRAWTAPKTRASSLLAIYSLGAIKDMFGWILMLPQGWEKYGLSQKCDKQIFSHK